MTAKAEEQWWEEFYDETFSTLLLDRDDDKTLPDVVAFLKNKLHLNPGDVIFDQCCGTGSISHALAKEGFKACGVDLIPSYIKKAQLIAQEQNLDCLFDTGDAFSYTTAAPCDAAINWYTSFGYVEDDQKNIEMLHRVYGSLKPGGYFALDYSHGPGQLRKATQSETEEITHELPEGTLHVTREYYFDLIRGMRGSTWTYTFPDGQQQQKSGESRLYMPKDIYELVKKAGFADIEFYGDYKGAKLELDSPRCICVARKEA